MPDVLVVVVLAAVAVFAIAAVTVGREAFRLGHQPPPTIFDLDEAVAHVADDLPFEAQARLSYDEVRELIVAELEHLEDKGVLAEPGRDVALAGGGTPEVVLADDEAVAVVLGRPRRRGWRSPTRTCSRSSPRSTATWRRSGRSASRLRPGSTARRTDWAGSDRRRADRGCCPASSRTATRRSRPRPTSSAWVP